MYKHKHTYTSAAASLTGLLSNATGATWTLSANDAGDDLAHLITIRNDAATDHSAKTATIVGTGPNGQSQTETVSLPAGTATVTTTKYFLTVTTVTPSATIGADTMDIGWAAGSVSPWFSTRRSVGEFQIGFGVTVDSGSPTYTVQHSFGDGEPFDHSSVAAETTSQSGEYLSPVAALRIKFTAAGGATLTVMQHGA